MKKPWDRGARYRFDERGYSSLLPDKGNLPSLFASLGWENLSVKTPDSI